MWGGTRLAMWMGGTDAVPWQKGQSGNPGGGRRKVVGNGMTLREMAREHTEKALGAYLAALNDDEAGHAVKVQAATALLDRGWGKPTQPIAGDDQAPPVSVALDMKKLSVETLREIAGAA